MCIALNISHCLKNKFLAVIIFSLVIVLIAVGIVRIRLRSSLQINLVQPIISQPTGFTSDYTGLSASTIANANETLVIPPPYDDVGGVIALMQANKDDILVVYENGLFRRLDLPSLNTLTEFDFKAASSNGVYFSADGRMVLTPGMVVPSSKLVGYSVWNTETGEIVKCWGSHCPNGDKEDDRFSNSGLLMDPNGRWIIEYGGSVIGVDGIKENLSSIIDLYDYGFNRDYHVSKMAFDPSGEYLTYALREGQVRVFKAEYYLSPNIAIATLSTNPEGPVTVFEGRRIYGSYASNAHIDTIDLTIDDTHRWLAWLTDENLSVWDLRKSVFATQLQLPIHAGNVIAFDRIGNLLAIGTKTGILVFDIEEKQKIAEFDVTEATTIYFSKDNRLMIFGDVDGSIHIWGVKE